MARKLRVFLNDVPVHIILKSIDAIDLYVNNDDVEYFKILVKEQSLAQKLDIHSYSCTKNSFEYLATPHSIESVPKFMQNISRQYIFYYNKKYNRNGTIWEGRYKSSLVDEENYLLDIMCFIEIKKNSICSSWNKNYNNSDNSILIEHQLYKNLGITQDLKTKKYQKIFHTLSEKTSEFILECLEKQIPTASTQYIKNIEQKFGLILLAKKRGRPKKQTKIKGKNMYKNLVVLDKEKHSTLKVNPMENLQFAKESTFVPLAANEVVIVGANFPVVFTADENPSIVSLVSLGGESLAINGEGKWITQYVPSYIRKYPFSLASTKEDANKKVILIDEESNLFSKSKGKQLFKKSGEQSDTLAHAVDFLKSYEENMVISKKLTKIIAQSGILEDRDISIGEGDEKKVLVNGFKVVDKEKLNALSDDILADWVRKGIIGFIDAHLKSLDNIQVLFNIAHERQN